MLPDSSFSSTKQITAKRVVITSFLVDVLDVVLNIAIAVITGSVVMIAEALQGFADLISAGLLFVGLQRSGRPADKLYPFGYGKELYFWTLLSALIMFTLAASFSFYFGYQRFLSPQPIEHLYLGYLALTIAVFSNGYSFSLSFRRLLGDKSPRQIWNIFFKSALVETKATFILDLMGTTVAVLGLTSLVIFGLTGNLRFDGLGAMMIGVTLAILSFFLLIGVKDLIVGRGASAETEDKIKQAVLDIPEVKEVLDLRTMHLGTDKLLVNLEVHVQDKLTTDEIEKLIDKMKDRVQMEVPTVNHIQVELETPV